MPGAAGMLNGKTFPDSIMDSPDQVSTQAPLADAELFAARLRLRFWIHRLQVMMLRGIALLRPPQVRQHRPCAPASDQPSCRSKYRGEAVHRLRLKNSLLARMASATWVTDRCPFSNRPSQFCSPLASAGRPRKSA
jgi:hypothetical protein